MLKRILVAGGSASGKSEWAEEETDKCSRMIGWPVVYVATASVHDSEFAERVRVHKQRRPPEWGLEEVPDDLPRLINEYSGRHHILLVDSVGTWMAGRLWQGTMESGWSAQERAVLKQDIAELTAAVAGYEGVCILVADEVGMGIVPENEMSRLFRDLNGLLNRRLADAADEAYLISCGLPVRLK